jgi:hypothetical protein
VIDQDWADVEREYPSAWRELKRLGRRARIRGWLTLLLTVLVTAGVVGFAAKKPRWYESRIVFRVTEGEIDTQTAPRTNGRLREYVSEVVFNNKRLLGVIKAHGLYPALMARDETLALDMMREDTEVEVWRNYFALPRSDEARSARLAVTFHARDKHQAFDVVTALGNIILEHERQSRIGQAEMGLRLADDAADAARELAARRKRELSTLELERQRARVPERALELVIEERGLEKALARAEIMVDKTDAMRERAYMRLQLEQHALGMRFDLIDAGRVAPEGMSRRLLLLVLGVVVFLLALPLSAIAVGAWDDRIYDTEDVRRLGLGVVGAVRRFDGDEAGSLAERLRAERHARLEVS